MKGQRLTYDKYPGVVFTADPAVLILIESTYARNRPGLVSQPCWVDFEKVVKDRQFFYWTDRRYKPAELPITRKVRVDGAHGALSCEVISAQVNYGKSIEGKATSMIRVVLVPHRARNRAYTAQESLFDYPAKKHERTHALVPKEYLQ